MRLRNTNTVVVPTVVLLLMMTVVLVHLSLVEGVKWRIVENIESQLYNQSYKMRSSSHLRHQHQHGSGEEGTFLLPPHSNNNNNLRRPIKIVVLAPLLAGEEYTLRSIMPAIVAAVESIEVETKRSQRYLGGWEHGAEIDFVDTKCSSGIGPLAAFEYYIHGNVDVFLGPVCPYVLAPVARYTSYWDVPHLTTSGQVLMFDEKNSTFRILTRMNGAFSRMAQFFNQVGLRLWAGTSTIVDLLNYDHSPCVLDDNCMTHTGWVLSVDITHTHFLLAFFLFLQHIQSILNLFHQH